MHRGNWKMGQSDDWKTGRGRRGDACYQFQQRGPRDELKRPAAVDGEYDGLRHLAEFDSGDLRG